MEFVNKIMEVLFKNGMIVSEAEFRRLICTASIKVDNEIIRENVAITSGKHTIELGKKSFEIFVD